MARRQRPPTRSTPSTPTRSNPPEGWGFVYFAERTTMVPHIVREHAGNVDDPERVRLTCGRCGKQYLGELKGSTFMKDHSTPGTCFNMVPRTRKRRRPADPSSASLPAPGGPRTPTPEATESRRIRTGFSEGFGDVGRDAMGMAKSGSARGREKPESLPSSDLEHLLTLPERSESRTWPANLAVEPLDPAGREGLPAFLSPPLPPDNNIHLHRLLELSHGFSPDDREFCMQFLPSLKLIIPRVLTILGCRILPAPRIRPGTVLPPTALFPGFDAGAASTSSGLFAWAHGPLAAEQVMCAAVLLSEQGKVLARGSLMMAGIGSGQGAACAFEGENWTRGSEAAAVALVFWRD
ncbi:hypothetical protein DFJ74DRAFT_654682 [Hyaloraphidium curvatum]|nr:hypothetical protein DFJ74DRAFT_654682 [Hyaloraphidium curvatum]